LASIVVGTLEARQVDAGAIARLAKNGIEMKYGGYGRDV